MRRLICAGCGAGENLNDPTGDIRTVQIVDLTPQFSEGGRPEAPVSEDLCTSCRVKVKQDFFNVQNEDPMEIPLMRVV